MINTGVLRKIYGVKNKSIAEDEALKLFEKNMRFITRHPDKWSIIDHVRSPCMHEPSQPTHTSHGAQTEHHGVGSLGLLQ